MILYFSATGNCKYVVTRLVQATGKESVSIVDCIRYSCYHFADNRVEDRRDGHVAWRNLKSICRENLKSLTRNKADRSYCL